MSDSKILDPNKIDPDDYPRGYKAPILLHQFFTKYNQDDPQDFIQVYTKNIRAIARKLGMEERLPNINLANCYKDLVRDGKMPTYLKRVANLGYDIRQIDGGAEFFNVEKYPELRDAIDLDLNLPTQEICTEGIPTIPLGLIRTDEGGVLSALEYSGVLERIFDTEVERIQSPLKLQPNEVDGLYAFKKSAGISLLAVEAKSKGRDVLLKHQIIGAARGALGAFGDYVNEVIPIGVKLEKDNTLFVIIYKPITSDGDPLELEAEYRFRLDPQPYQWLSPQERSGQQPLL